MAEAPTPPADESPPPQTGAGAPRLKQALTLYGITLAVTVGLTLLSEVFAPVRGYLLVLVAATFLYLPIEVLHRGGEDPEAFGIHRRHLRRSLRIAGLASLLTFPVYLVGFHVWQTVVLHKQFRPEVARFDRWPVELEDAPLDPKPPREGEVRLWAEGDKVALQWHLPLGQRLEGHLDGRPPADVGGGSEGFARYEAHGDAFRLDLQAGGDRLPAERLRLGAAGSAADAVPYEARRSYLWLANLVLVQLLLVALPEEVFYRGYLQTRFDAIFRRRRRVLGVSVSVGSLLLTSALFGVGHFLVIPHPQRLAVFFPSLLFGWMRAAGGGVTAGVLYHAACNLLVELAGAFYV